MPPSPRCSFAQHGCSGRQHREPVEGGQIDRDDRARPIAFPVHDEHARRFELSHVLADRDAVKARLLGEKLDAGPSLPFGVQVRRHDHEDELGRWLERAARPDRVDGSVRSRRRGHYGPSSAKAVNHSLPHPLHDSCK